jgi:hypothetical protein
VVPCCLPIRAMSLFKSPHKMTLFRGLLCMWLNIVVRIMGMRVMSSMWVGMYRCIRKNVERGWFLILMIYRYEEILVVVGILVTFPRNAYFWCIRIRRPPLRLLYGCPCIRQVWVGVVVLLNIILYCGNILCKYLVDLDVVILVS